MTLHFYPPPPDVDPIAPSDLDSALGILTVAICGAFFCIGFSLGLLCSRIFGGP